MGCRPPVESSGTGKGTAANPKRGPTSGNLNISTGFPKARTNGARTPSALTQPNPTSKHKHVWQLKRTSAADHLTHPEKLSPVTSLSAV